MFLVRGENVVLLGEIVSTLTSHYNPHQLPADPLIHRTQDLDLEDAPLEALTLMPWDGLAALIAKEQKAKTTASKATEAILYFKQGFGAEGDTGDAY